MKNTYSIHSKAGPHSYSFLESKERREEPLILLQKIGFFSFVFTRKKGL
jgi:hypothetical protein